ncbi:MAG: DEAD/DEAH box helicase family protein [Selenomonadaceae bacterium]
MLLPEQIRDVRFAEKRLLEKEGTGVLFTNGTGTGKTFTGLGIVKHFLYKGKSNILIVTPSAKINSDWIDNAKKFFHLKVTPLADTEDAGRGLVITTYSNMGANNALVSRKWDIIIPDKSHSLMSGESGNPTDALKNLRAITMNSRGFRERFQRLHSKEYEKIADMPDGKRKDAAYSKLNEQREKDIAAWTKTSENEKAKVTFLSATPWAYVPDVDYAEGYLFKYPEVDGSSYNSGDGREKFYMSNFGYRMRYNKLTKPEASVDSSVMEVQFHQKLRDADVLSGRALTVDKDYDRGFILVDGGIGKKIDEGFDWLSKKEHGLTEFSQYMQQQYKGNQKDYLLEAVKAKEVIPLINAYLKSGKKVVVFHGYKKGGAKHPFRIEHVPNDLQEQYANFAQMRPDLIGLDLKKLHSPIVTLQQEYGNKLALFNGDVSKKDREQAVKDFNDDKNGKNLILVQQDAGQAGISLHDTTGKHQRVLINLGMPTKPVAAIQIEGRIYRVGQQSNAIFRYLNTGTLMEKNAFANKIAERASTAENLALGEQARDLKNSFIDVFEETMDSDEWKKNLPGAKGEGTGGKEKDQAINNALTEFDKAKTYYFAQQKKNAHTKAAEGKDYFATPEPLGYKMAEWANLKQGDSALEPSAGHGAIARFFPSDTKNVAIEPSAELAPRAKMAMNGGEVLNTTFEDYYIGNKFNAVVMNPPFGTGGKTAIDHVEKAFRHLKDGGRLVAIIPDGPSANKHLEKWLYGNENANNKLERIGEPDAVLMKTISLPDVTFERAGTKVNAKVIIIDKQETESGKEAASQYQSGQYDVNANNISKFFDAIEHITAPNYEVKSSQEDPLTDKESNFDTGTHKNTKTGEEQAKATFKDYVSKDSYKAINSVAKRNDGYYSRFAKAFLFNDEPSRDAFIKEANALMATNVKASSLNFAERLRSNIELMPDNELPSREQALQAFGKTLGIDTVFFKGNKVLNGFYHNGVSFINTQSKVPNSWIFWHEAFHWMGKNNVALFNDMVDYLESKEGFSDAQLNEYRDSIGRPEMTNIETIEEMMADYMPDVHRRVSLFQNLGKDNKSLATRFVAWVHDLMDRFSEFMNTPAAGLTNTQKQSMREAFEKLACSMVDENGNRIFKVMRKSREIRMVSGEPLVNEKYSINNSGYDLGAEKLNDDIQKWEKLCDLYDASDKAKWKSKENGKLFDFMDMPLALELVGAKNMKLQVYGSFFEHAIRSKHPGMDSAVLKKLPASMADPVMILKTPDPKKFIFALTIKDNNGATVIVPVELEKLVF